MCAPLLDVKRNALVRVCVCVCLCVCTFVKTTEQKKCQMDSSIQLDKFHSKNLICKKKNISLKNKKKTKNETM
jgi:hypothetical protein